MTAPGADTLSPVSVFPPPVLRWRVVPKPDPVQVHALAASLPEAQVVPSAAVVGGGGAPELELASWSISLPHVYAEPLRRGHTPVVGRVEHGRLLLDLRCVPAERDADLVAAVIAAARDR